jgi:hypothetical protein
MANERFDEVVNNNIIVNKSIMMHKTGTYTYEEALEEAVIQLANQNKELFAKLLSSNQQSKTIWRP